MQKIIVSIMLLIVASMPLTANALVVTISDSTCEGEGCSQTYTGDPTVQALFNDNQLQCFSATDPAAADPTATPTVPATFTLLQAGDIQDMVMSDVLCRNISSSPVTLAITADQQFNASPQQWYFMSLQGSFYNLAGAAQASDNFNASLVVNESLLGQSFFPGVANFTESFGPQNPVQIVNVLNCGECESANVNPGLNVTLAPGDGIYLFGSDHFGSAPTAEKAAAYLASLAGKMDVHNPVNVNSNGQILVDLFGANSLIPVQNGQPITVKFDVRSVDIKSLKFGPVGGPFVAPVGPQTFVDLNHDKIVDVRLRFPNPQWECTDKVAVLTGNINGSPFTATQNITPHPCH